LCAVLNDLMELFISLHVSQKALKHKLIKMKDPKLLFVLSEWIDLNVFIVT